MTSTLLAAICNGLSDFVDCSQVNITDIRSGSVVVEVHVTGIVDEDDANSVSAILSNFQVEIPDLFGPYSVNVQQSTEGGDTSASTLDGAWGTTGISLFAVALVVLIVIGMVIYQRRSNKRSDQANIAAKQENSQAAWDALLKKKPTRSQFNDQSEAGEVSSNEPSAPRRLRPILPKIKRNAVSDIPNDASHKDEKGISIGPRAAPNLQMPVLPPVSPGKGVGSESSQVPISPVKSAKQLPSSTIPQVPTFRKPSFNNDSSNGNIVGTEMRRPSNAYPFTNIDASTSNKMNFGGKAPSGGVQRLPTLGFPVPPKPPIFADPFSEQRRSNNLPPMMPGMPPPSIGRVGVRGMPPFPTRPSPRRNLPPGNKPQDRRDESNA